MMSLIHYLRNGVDFGGLQPYIDIVEQVLRSSIWDACVFVGASCSNTTKDRVTLYKFLWDSDLRYRQQVQCIYLISMAAL